ncbi:hypothetical protein ACFFRR_006783 [Megaselia abdita]
MRFFRLKLQPSMIGKSRLQNTDLKLIPYGKVIKLENEGHIELSCQHGEPECELNALHACIIENNSVEESFNLISCLMRGFNTNVDVCANHYNVDIQKAKDCKKSRSTVNILEKYGNETSKIQAYFIPAIGMGDEHNYDEQYDLRQNFDNMFCEKFTSKFNYTLKGCKGN